METSALNECILAALSQQCECYRELAKLARLQHELIQDSRTEELLLVLSQRQGLVEAIANLQLIVAPAKREWSKFVAELPDAEREKAQSLLDETKQLLEEITTSDREDTIVLQQRKFKSGKEINRAQLALKVNRNYAAAAYGPKKSGLDIQR